MAEGAAPKVASNCPSADGPDNALVYYRTRFTFVVSLDGTCEGGAAFRLDSPIHRKYAASIA